MPDINDQLRQFILDTYLRGELPENLQDDTPLQTSGILDSLATLGLISFIERTFGIELTVQDTGIEQFDSIGAITATVQQKLAATQPASH